MSLSNQQQSVPCNLCGTTDRETRDVRASGGSYEALCLRCAASKRRYVEFAESDWSEDELYEEQQRRPS